jgi:DNA-binding transcriptional ArsR family regulator
LASKKEKAERRRTLRRHPARDEILEVMRASDKPISPTQVARITGRTLGSTAYHVRTLAAAGVIELADEGRVRGAAEHFYALVPDQETDAPLFDGPRELLRVAGALAVKLKGEDLPVPTNLDAEAHAELEAILDRLKPRVQRIAEAATERSRAT